MPGLEVAAAVASIIAGIATCTKYAKDIHDKHREKRALASEALELHGFLSNSGAKIATDWTRLQPFCNGYPGPIEFMQSQNHIGLLEGAQNNISRLEGNLRNLLAPATSQLRVSSLSSDHSLAQLSHNLTTQALSGLHSQMPTSSSPTQLSLAARPVVSSSSWMRSLWPANLCRNAEQYRIGRKAFYELATEVQQRSDALWQCMKCSRHFSKVSAPIENTVGYTLWIGAKGLFKAHGKGGWYCIWQRVDPSCYERPFEDEWELMKHMRRHHTTVDANPANFKMEKPADICGDEFGFGAIIRGRELQNENFVG